MIKKLLDYFLSCVFLVYFGLILCIFHPIQVFCFKVLGSKYHQKSVNILNAFLVYGKILNGSWPSLEISSPLPAKGPIIFVANHSSMFDIPGIIWFFKKYTPLFVSKIELAKGIPSISYNLKVGGAALIDRKDPKSAIREIAKLGSLMTEKGFSAAIFPEGTRSRNGELKPFAVGGVATLVKYCPEAVIVPVAIKNTGVFNPKGIFPLRSFTSISWTSLKPIDTELTIEQKVEQAAQQIADFLGKEYPGIR